jgi:hypothetical protein
MRNLHEVTRSISKPTIEKENRRVIITPLFGYDIMISELATITKSHRISRAVVHLGLFLAPTILQITLHNTIGHMIQVSHQGLFEIAKSKCICTRV